MVIIALDRGSDFFEEGLSFSALGPSLDRQNLTYKDGPHTEKIKSFLMVIDP